MRPTIKGALGMALIQAVIFIVVIQAIEAFSDWEDERDYPNWFDRCMVEQHADVRACHSRWRDLHKGADPPSFEDGQ